MDTKLKQRPFLAVNTSSSNYFPVQRGYSIFSQNLLQVRPPVINRGFASTAVAATTTKSLPYLSIIHDSPLTGTSQGQNNNSSDMGGLISIISSLPLVGMVQKMFTNFFSSKHSESENMGADIEPYEFKAPDCSAEKHLNQNTVSSYIQKQLCDSNCDNYGEKSRKRVSRNTTLMTVSPLSKALPVRSAFNPNHFYHKSKVGQKNRLEKQRHNIQCDIYEDLAISSDEDDDFDPINEDAHFASFEIGCNDISPKLTVVYKCSPETRSGCVQKDSLVASKSFVFSLEDFPSMSKESACIHPKYKQTLGSPKRTKPINFLRSDSVEQSTDDDFVVLDDDSVKTTPTSNTGTSSLKTLLMTGLNCGARQRQISECSDDSVVIFFGSDGDQQSCWSDTDLSDGKDDDESDYDDTETTNVTDINHQPDSGFDEREKKVRFCMKPEVHVIRAWDFAYRQARLGPWEGYGRDRERFKKRIWLTEQKLAFIFDPDHRTKMLNERFS